MVEQSTAVNYSINTYSYHTIATPYHIILLILAFMQDKEHSDYSKRAYLQNRAYLHTKVGLIFELQFTISFEAQKL